MVLRWYTFRLAEHYFWYTFSLAYATASQRTDQLKKLYLEAKEEEQNEKK